MRLFDELSLRDVRSTTTFRLATMLGVLFCIGTIALGALIYGLTTRELTARSDQILRHEAARLLRVPADRLATEIPVEVERNARGLDRFSLLAPNGRLLTGNIPPPTGLTIDLPVDVEPREGLGPMRVLAVRASNGEVILLARDINEIRYLERHILIVITISCLAIIPGVLLIGTVLSFQPLRRVQDLQTIARKVAAGEFSLRMPDTGKSDELDRIALTVNTMIEDVSRIVDQVKNVTDAIAHDLRTPLTRVRSRLEALRGANEARDTAVDALIADLDIVLERFGALLRISEIEAREQRSGFQNISLAPLVRDIVDLYQPLAEEAGKTLDTAHVEDIEVFADRNLLFEALNNLVDNAIKYARREVRIAVWRDGSIAAIKIQDDGPGIPADERYAVLRRFYRRADAGGLQGSGLGLSVVAAILHLHRFNLELSDAGPGLVAKIVMSGR